LTVKTISATGEKWPKALPHINFWSLPLWQISQSQQSDYSLEKSKLYKLPGLSEHYLFCNIYLAHIIDNSIDKINFP